MADAEALLRESRASRDRCGARPASGTRSSFRDAPRWLSPRATSSSAARLPRVPLFLTRARVATLTANQPFDVAPLLAQGIEVDARLEEAIANTVADYRAPTALLRRPETDAALSS